MKKLTILGILAVTLFLGKAASAEQVEIKAGDTLSELSVKYGVSVDDLVKINNIEDPSLIFAGEIIETEATADTSSTAAATTATVQSETASATTTSTASSYTATSSSAKEWIAQKESGGSYDARNGIYIGRYQLTASYLNGDYSVENQERVADAYVASRYGSWENAQAFWLANGWY